MSLDFQIILPWLFIGFVISTLGRFIYYVIRERYLLGKKKLFFNNSHITMSKGYLVNVIKEPYVKPYKDVSAGAIWLVTEIAESIALLSNNLYSFEEDGVMTTSLKISTYNSNTILSDQTCKAVEAVLKSKNDDAEVLNFSDTQDTIMVIIKNRTTALTL